MSTMLLSTSALLTANLAAGWSCVRGYGHTTTQVQPSFDRQITKPEEG
jgi:hypothetical protein